MKPILFDFDFIVPKSLLFKPTNGNEINVTLRVMCSGGVIDGNPTVVVNGFVCTDRCFQFIEDNFQLFKEMQIAAMDEYKKLHNNAIPIDMNVVQMAEYGITNIHPALKHLN